MRLFGVINASPDSLHEESIVTSPTEAGARAEWLLANGAWGFDLGGQGSTYAAGTTTVDEEWARIEPLLDVLLSYEVPISIDTWRPETARRSLESGITWLNAADGLQQQAMIDLVVQYQCPTVLPFLSGPDPLSMDHVTDHDPVRVINDFVSTILDRVSEAGVRDLMVIDPGTGFAPHDWPWDERYLYQKEVYSNLDKLRTHELPLYIALPWKETEQHDELLDIVIDGKPEYGRCHHPDRIVAAINRQSNA